VRGSAGDDRAGLAGKAPDVLIGPSRLRDPSRRDSPAAMVTIDGDSSVLARLFGPVDPDFAIPHPSDHRLGGAALRSPLCACPTRARMSGCVERCHRRRPRPLLRQGMQQPASVWTRGSQRTISTTVGTAPRRLPSDDRKSSKGTLSVTVAPVPARHQSGSAVCWLAGADHATGKRLAWLLLTVAKQRPRRLQLRHPLVLLNRGGVGVLGREERDGRGR
jgi:hypothetical protein